ncbi:hypothetical protein K493DRAFT_312681 [Basidiobolus meristosporus CBS 931.73]|uniref:Uncharacterized protein n=1 Tax=Basidiobolus meristosporus CBS 931.73 TaxID=1314790 RepID=A0A1Y1YS20_9FUNG|nr:hypothetical protein K493DRAFT_312681 [Basidiobolus meristosporus CBS 931.73]|eukprot:ORY00766.1 hypothetical protein K493DRAFT_312681 [Basidiobolus meristosporus CBS 931.73]
MKFFSEKHLATIRRKKWWFIGGTALVVIAIIAIVLGVVLTRKDKDGIMPSICITGMNQTNSINGGGSTQVGEISPASKSGTSNLISLAPNSTALCYSVLNNLYDIIPDFSGVGYRAGLEDIPTSISTVQTLSPSTDGSDDTARIQSAILELGKRPVGPNGYRGALLLSSGVYRIGGSINITASGIVLRGDSKGNTTLLATGNSTYTVIQVNGPVNGLQSTSSRYNIVSSYTPLGARQVNVSPSDSRNLRVGDEIIITRTGNQDWIQAINMANLSSRDPPGRHSKNWVPFELRFTRTVKAVDYKKGIIGLDIPLTNSIDQKWGGGYVQKFTLPNRLQNIGIEYINGISQFDPSKTSSIGSQTPYFSDENHADKLITFTGVQNAWARYITSKYFDHFIEAGANAKWITVEYCSYSDPVSVITGGRRYSYLIESGAEQILYQHVTASESRHAFAYGSHVTGPNVFYNCTAQKEYDTSGKSFGAIIRSRDYRLTCEIRTTSLVVSGRPV